MAELNDRQIAHRRAMLQHLTQVARDRESTVASFRTAQRPERSGISVVPTANSSLTHSDTMDTIAMDER
jgi:hypothetical protein